MTTIKFFCVKLSYVIAVNFYETNVYANVRIEIPARAPDSRQVQI